MNMRTRKEILEDRNVVCEGRFQTSGGNLAILEVLLDIRELLLDNFNSEKYNVNKEEWKSNPNIMMSEAKEKYR